MKTSAACQFCGSRGSQSPRSSSRMRLPDGARWRASVPPPAPVPMMITSWVSISPSSGGRADSRGSPGLLGICGGERLGDVLQRLALGVDAENDLDDPAEDHDPSPDEIADEEARTARAVAD